MAFTLGKSRNGGCTLPRSVRMRLAQARDAQGLDHAELARQLGIQAVHLERLARGLATPKYDLLESWARQLGFEVEIRVNRTEP